MTFSTMGKTAFGWMALAAIVLCCAAIGMGNAEAAGVNSIARALRPDIKPLNQRQITTAIDGKVTKLDDQTLRLAGTKVQLTAEKFPGASPEAVVPPDAVKNQFPNLSAITAYSTLYTSATPSGQQARSFKVGLTPLGTLRYDGARDRFVAQLVAVLINEANANDTSDISPEFRLDIQADGGTSDPSPVTFAKLGSPKTVTLAVSAPADMYKIKTITMLDESDPIDLGITRPLIVVKPVNKTIRGLGLEATEVNIQVTGAESVEGQDVTLTATPVGIEPGRVKLDKSGAATVQFRSRGLTPVVITADHPGFVAGMETVTFTLPWLFFVLTMLGGIAGAFIGLDNANTWKRNLSVGAAMGLVVVVAYLSGFQLSQISVPAGVPTEGGSFVLAVIAGFLGRQGMNLILPKPAQP